MSTLLIEGGHRLEGRVAVEGNKNAALPLLAACLLTEEECFLTNVPRIGDVEVMARLLVELGAVVDGIGTTTVRVRAARVHSHAPDRVLVGRLRGSVLLLGPLLSRTGKAHLAAPGGDFPARRSIGIHMDALRVWREVDAAAERGERLLAFYHSHIDCGAYFSQEDRDMAAPPPDRMPTYPEIWHVVLACWPDGLREACAFRWDGRDFAAHPLDGFVRGTPLTGTA